MGPSRRLLSLVELDAAVAAAPDLRRYRLLSLGDYFSSLTPHGALSWERLAVSVADRWSASFFVVFFLPRPPA